MNWNDQDIDQLFKGAKTPEAPPFEESFWDEIEGQLPPRKRRKAALWWFGGSVAVIASLCTWWLLQDVAVHTEPAARNEAKSSTHTPKEPVSTAGISEMSVAPVLHHASESDGNDRLRTLQKRTYPKSNRVSESATEVWTKSTDVTEVQSVSAEEKDPQNLAFIQLPFATVRYPGTGVVSRHIQDPASYRAYRFYAEMTAGAGQSYRRSVSGSGGLLHYYTCGAGIQTQAGRVIVSFGVNLRADFLYNLVSREYIDYLSNHKLETRYKQLYSVETPISFGVIQGRNTFGVQVIPGFQAGFSGREAETVNEQLVRSEQVTGKVDDSKTLTMETGVFFRHTLAPQWQLGGSVNVDVLRPFGAPAFDGKQTQLPVNAGVSVRYVF